MKISAVLLALSVVFAWALNFVAVKIGVETVPPLFLNTLRFFLLSIPAIFFVKPPKAPFRLVLAYGLVFYGLSFSLLFIGIRWGVTAGLASVLFQTQAFFSWIFAIFLFGERLHRWQVLGGLIAIAGIGVIGANINANANEGLSIAGVLAVIAGSAAWGAGNAISKKLGKINMLSLVVWGSFVAWPPTFVLSLCLEGPAQIIGSLYHFSYLAAAALLYMILCSTLYGFAVWAWLTHHHPISTLVPFTLLIPILGLIDSATLMHEPMQPWKILACLLVVAGLFVNFLGPRIQAALKRFFP